MWDVRNRQQDRPHGVLRERPNRDARVRDARSVHLAQVDAARFPLFGGAEYVDVVLEEGQLLYIPPRWWHLLESREMSRLSHERGGLIENP